MIIQVFYHFPIFFPALYPIYALAATLAVIGTLVLRSFAGVVRGGAGLLNILLKTDITIVIVIAQTNPNNQESINNHIAM
jgi:hypothetical protein